MKLEPCKFCGGVAKDPSVDQIEINSWLASIECGECDVTVTLQFTSAAPQKAIADVVEMWNSEPGASQ
ncbi:hypothetical protein G3N59_01215 [Paraburkholderia sp. Ac-20340]|uniref:hypothetical protein n=1 Tax=Paraburkholderia sp. Ac-20340 TaxID=2703888 RepID=UPI00197E3D79|nr:hypothetical protein [Paraburkholderia sp. Ac-20340]MBN3851987.1 hypothetical protein [Paraburkholderia sp. Ac-20340]